MFPVIGGGTGIWSFTETTDAAAPAAAAVTRALRGGTPVSEPKACLATTATRLALNHRRSARVHRESYLGTWLPEPVLTGPGPEEHAEMADSLSMPGSAPQRGQACPRCAIRSC
jgi:DNA-directed RNA polymerase specialized sigma24 family protein